MKKAAALSFTVLLVLLCSCSAVKTPTAISVNRSFFSKAQIQYKQTAYTADFECDENGCSAVFLSPEALKGLKITVNGGKITYSLSSLTFTANLTPEQTLPAHAIYLAINSQPEALTKNEEGYTISGHTKYGRYIMNIDSKTFTPLFIEYEEAGITVIFKECNIK